MYLDKKNLYPEYIKNSSNSTTQRQSSSEMGKGFIMHFFKDIYIINSQQTHKKMLDIVIKEMEIITTVRY